MRVHAQPLRGEDAQDVRMSHQQHIMAVFQQRRNLVDGALGACRRFFQRLARPGMDHLFARRQGLDPVALQRGRQRARPVTPHIPFKTAGLTHLLARTPLGSAVIPFSDAVQHTVVRKTSQFSGLARPLQRTGKHNLRPLIHTLFCQFSSSLTKRFIGDPDVSALLITPCHSVADQIDPHRYFLLF